MLQNVNSNSCRVKLAIIRARKLSIFCLISNACFVRVSCIINPTFVFCYIFGPIFANIIDYKCLTIVLKNELSKK